MVDLPTRSFDTIVSNTVAGIQGRASQLIDFGKGSPLLAIAQGFASIFLWFQGLSLQLYTAIRLSTASGNDVDTFVSDFMPVIPGTNSPRLGMQSATGFLTFTRYTAGPSSCFIGVGTTVKSTDGTQTAIVIADPTLSTYSSTLNGYTLVAGLGSITVPAQSVNPGSQGNVVAGSFVELTTPLTGIDTVTNLASFINGADQEGDSALKSRFAAYILGLSRGDVFGLTASIDGANVNVQWDFVENYDPSGAWHPGYFFVVADDGSGAPSPSFMQAITNAANAVRPLSVQCAVFPVTTIFVEISLIITTATGFDHNTVVGLVANAIANGVNTLGIGNRLDYNRISTWAYSVAGVTGVSAVLLNGLAGDAASISATKPTNDGFAQMGLYTIKCNSCEVS